jgi:IS1 family transposase
VHTLSVEKKRAVLNALLEGCSIRATERLTGVTKKAITKLLIKTGEHCAAVMDNRMRDVRCSVIEADEIWGFVGKKHHKLTPEQRRETDMGDQYTFIAFDPASKLVPVFLVGRRHGDATDRFIGELRARVVGRVQISTDAWHLYPPAIERHFGSDVDYAIIEKHYAGEQSGRYSPPKMTGATITEMMGMPMPERISTSYVERNNLTMRMQIRRLTRLTNAFSRKLRNMKAAIALFFAHYNLCRIHSSIRMTPAMAAGVSDHVWSLDELIHFRVS